VPVLAGPGGVQPIVYSNTVHAGYGERMLLSAPMLLEVPNGLPAHHAALTEPIAVGVHAVSRSGIGPDDGALVLGCGPIGLAVIAALGQRGIEPIVAADLSTARRHLAATMGAHEVVDPRSESTWSVWGRAGRGKPLVVFEAIGVPGVLNDILRSAPQGSRVLVVGVCMDDDVINPFFGVTKELAVLFSFGYTPDEFARSLGWIAEGEIDVAPMVTARVGLDETPWAFAALRDPEEHCKVIVEP
jgi:threonine dehydrogenase-like Zn-dependent dehydrogenase